MLKFSPGSFAGLHGVRSSGELTNASCCGTPQEGLPATYSKPLDSVSRKSSCRHDRHDNLESRSRFRQLKCCIQKLPNHVKATRDSWPNNNQIQISEHFSYFGVGVCSLFVTWNLCFDHYYSLDCASG